MLPMPIRWRETIENNNAGTQSINEIPKGTEKNLLSASNFHTEAFKERLQFRSLKNVNVDVKSSVSLLRVINWGVHPTKMFTTRPFIVYNVSCHQTYCLNKYLNWIHLFPTIYKLLQREIAFSCANCWNHMLSGVECILSKILHSIRSEECI